MSALGVHITCQGCWHNDGMKRKIDGKSALVALGATLGAVAIALWGVPGLGHWLKPQLSIALWEIIAFGTCAFGLLVYQGVKYFLVGGGNKKPKFLSFTNHRPQVLAQQGRNTVSTGLVAGLVTVITACLTVSATLYTVQRNDDQQAKVLKEAQDELVQTQQSQQENADLERITEMDTRFTVAADHLSSSSSAATRAMGVSEFAMLADDWGRYDRLDDDGTKKAAAIDALVNYLKTPFELTSDDVSDNRTGSYGQEMSVRSLISATLHDRLDASVGGACYPIATTPPADPVNSQHYAKPSAGDYFSDTSGPVSGPSVFGSLNFGSVEPGSSVESGDMYILLTKPNQCWANHKFDFTDANFYMANFTDAYFAQPVDFVHTHFYGITCFVRTVFLEGVSFWEAQYFPAGWNGTDVAGYTSFARAVFKGGADFDGTVFGHSPDGLDVDFIGTDFNGDSRFVDASFKGAVSFDYAEFSRDYLYWDGSTPVADFSGMSVANDCGQDCVTGPDGEMTNVIFHHGALIDSLGKQLDFAGSYFYDKSTLSQYNWCVEISEDGDDTCSTDYQQITIESEASIDYTFALDGHVCHVTPGAVRTVELTHC